MKRRIIEIHQEKCNGCGLCVEACHEGAIALVDGVAKLMRDDYCDGLGDCLPNCPTGAISFVEKETVPYDAEAVKRHMEKRHNNGGCPGARARSVQPEQTDAPAVSVRSRLQTWPVQIKLAAPNAPYFQGAKLLIAADCTAYAYANMHSEFMKGKITLIGCPKLDAVDYTDKLTEIIRGNDIQSVTIVRMEVPCCGGLEHAAREALRASGKFLPWQVVTISIDGKILDR